MLAIRAPQDAAQQPVADPLRDCQAGVMTDAEPDEAIETPQDTPEGSETPEEAQRRKFREALAKKNQQHHGQTTAGGSVQHAHTSPAVTKRVHRRKSG